jgi:SSS family solute:Na+ symporter
MPAPHRCARTLAAALAAPRDDCQPRLSSIAGNDAGAAGVLTALVPGSIILIAAGTLLANNIFRTFRPQATDAAVSRMAKLLVPAVALVSVFFTLQGATTIVALLLMGYSTVTRRRPGFA